MSRNWDGYWLDRCNLNAMMSTCRRRQVGAVATIGRRSFADAFNGNLPGAPHCTDGACPRCSDPDAVVGELEFCFCVHAEANIVTFCAAQGISMVGATVYCTTQPCMDCLKLLISANVDEVVYEDRYVLPAGFKKHIDGLIKLRRFYE